MRMVVKVGTSTLAHPTGLINLRRVEALCRVLSDLKNAGHQLILVSSGAIGMGAGKLGLKSRPQDVAGKQAAAAVGQCELMYTYDRLFGQYNHVVAQLLLTADDFSHADRRANLVQALERLLEMNALPVINENDTVATEEFGVGDNDTLSALVAVAAHAELLVLLSDIEGLYTADPRRDPKAQLMNTVPELTAEIERMAGGSGSGLGTGGMTTQLHAARLATEAGMDMVITHGAKPENLYAIVEGQPVGTRFLGHHA